MPESLDSTPGDRFCSLPRHLSSASAARTVVRGFLADVTGGACYAEAAELILAEPVAHTVLRPRGPEHLLIDVLFECTAPAGLRIEVYDTGLAHRGRVPDEPQAGPGPRLVRELSSAWGQELSEGELAHGPVWAQLDPPSGGTA